MDSRASGSVHSGRHAAISCLPLSLSRPPPSLSGSSLSSDSSEDFPSLSSYKTALTSVRRRIASARRFFVRKPASTSASGPCIVNRLPVEIWLLIFRLATELEPHPLSPPCGPTHDFLLTPTLKYAAYSRACATKLALMLVCRGFRAPGEALLYEFVWIARSRQARKLSAVLAGPRGAELGHHILHVALHASALERADPEHVRVILGAAPRLETFSDRFGVRRSRWDERPNPACTPSALFALLARGAQAGAGGGLRQLAWTTYDDEPFHLAMAPLAVDVAAFQHLEYLELAHCSPFEMPPLATAAGAEDGPQPVALPSLRSLKLALDNTTFDVLSTWSMPALMNLCVSAADFAYAGPGFAHFFAAHGPAVRQLELGHSSGEISSLTPASSARVAQRVPLAKWTPNLHTLICSADAEWHWRTPDWIAPHVLLPAHPTLTLIGIRDIGARLRADARTRPVRPDARTEEELTAPFFPLLEQLASLLRKDAFPQLAFIRDLDEDSHAMRTRRPAPQITAFWTRVLKRTRTAGPNKVYFEDSEGVNITERSLKRASLCIG